jgi:hypothetical protein
MIKTKLAVPAGTWVHSSLGETGFGLARVNFGGISEPSTNAVVLSVSPGMAGALVCLPWSCAIAVPTVAVNRMTQMENLLVDLIVLSPPLSLGSIPGRRQSFHGRKSS